MRIAKLGPTRRTLAASRWPSLMGALLGMGTMGPALALDAGPWVASYYCGPRTDVQPVRPPYALGLPKLRIVDNAFTLTVTSAPPATAVEQWQGRLEQGVLKVSAQGERSASDRWTYRFEGPMDNTQAVQIPGAIYDASGRKLRSCTFALQEDRKLPNVRGIPFVSDRTLMSEFVMPHEVAVKASPTLRPLRLLSDEQVAQALGPALQDRVRRLGAQANVNALALVENGDLIWQGREHVSLQSWFNAASMTKTVTAAAVGQAICQRHLALGDRIDRWLPELAGQAVGAATVRDVLMMASGLADPVNAGVSGSGSFLPAQAHNAYYTDPAFRFLPLLFSPELLTMHRGLLRQTQPGERFSYLNLNPMWLGLILQRATGQSYARWVQAMVFDPAGFEGGGVVAQDRDGIASADGVFGLRLRVGDWIRFGLWWRESQDKGDCLGEFLRDASRTQIRNGPSRALRRTAPDFAGYGYLVWTEPEGAPSTAWAIGYGGQMLGWNPSNRRIMLTMSTLENWEHQAIRLYADWVGSTPR